MPDDVRGAGRTVSPSRAASLVLLLALSVIPAASQDTGFSASFSSSARASADLERMATLAGQSAWPAWAAVAQQLLDDDRRQVIERDAEFHVGLRRRVYDLLEQAPPAARAAYLQHAEEPARQAYENATKRDDEPAVREAYARYRLTRGGALALRWLADRALDRGRSEEALEAYSRLSSAANVSPEVLLRGAMAASASRNPEAAKAFLEQIRRDWAGHPVRLAGEQMTGKQAADQLAASLGRQPAAPDAVRRAYGTHESTAAGTPALASGELKRLWEYQIPLTRLAGSAVFRRTNPRGYTRTAYRFQFLSYPAVEGDQVWVQGPRSLTCLDRVTGNPQWDFKQFVLREDELPPSNANSRTGGIYYPSDRPSQGAPSLEGHLIAGRFPMAAVQATGSRWPADMALGIFDSRGGSLRWLRTAGGNPPGIYYNVPLLSGNVVYSGLAQHRGGITEYRAQALDAATGEPLWDCYLGGGTDPQGAVDGSPPLVHQGLVWTETSLYTLAGIDIITGDPWLIYRHTPTPASVTRLNGRIYLRDHPLTLLAASADRVYYAQRWGPEIVAIDQKQARRAWSRNKPADISAEPVAAAVDTQRIYLAGSGVQACSLTDGSIAWSWQPPEDVDLPGIPALGGARLYVPCGRRVFVLDAENGKQLAEFHIGAPDAEGNSMQVMVAAGDTLYLYTADKLVAFAIP